MLPKSRTERVNGRMAIEKTSIKPTSRKTSERIGYSQPGRFTFLGFVAEEIPENEFRTGNFENDDGPGAERDEGERRWCR